MEPHIPTHRFPQLRIVSQNLTTTGANVKAKEKASKRQFDFVKGCHGMTDDESHHPHPLQPQQSSMNYLPSSRIYKSIRKPKLLTHNETENNAAVPAQFFSSHSNASSKTFDELREMPPQMEQWSLEMQDNTFSSLPLFCHVKLQEAKQMTAQLLHPNRFLVSVCFQLWDKWLQSAAWTASTLAKDDCSTKVDTDFLHQLRNELATAIYMPTSADEPRLPYFTAYRRICQNTHTLLQEMEHREKLLAAKQKLPFFVERAFLRKERQSHQLELRFVFHSWQHTIKTEKELLNLKFRHFRSVRDPNVRALFTAWRVESLRSAYQRESIEYQTMLSASASSLGKKETQIKEQDVTIASMTKLIETLTTTNTELISQVDILNTMNTSRAEPANDYNSDFYANVCRLLSAPTNAETVDIVETKQENVDDDENTMERLNQMLSESVFIMARVVESCSIQLLKDTMESLESQLDGSMFQKLLQLYHAKQAKPTHNNSPLRKHVSIKQLAQLPADEFLLCWFQMQLMESTISERASDRVIKNFTTDLCDGRRYALLLHQLFPTWFDASMVQELDTDERVKNIARFHTIIQPGLPQMVTCDSIHAASVTENVAFVGLLYGLSISSFGNNNLEKQRHSFLNIATSWQRARGLMLQLKRIKDQHDPLTAVYLLKELRNCEARCKQLHSDLCTISSASNEAAGVYSVMAYRVLGLTWTCLNARLKKEPLQIVDERLQEQLAPYTLVSHTSVCELMADDEGPKVSNEDSRAAVAVQDRHVSMCAVELQKALRAYARDIHDIFQHYSMSSDGSIASLSVAEFTQFVEDCKMYDDRFPESMTGRVYTNAQRAFASPLKSNHATQTRELGGSEFVDALLQLSSLKFPHTSSMIDRFQALMDKIVLPNAVRSQCVSFRADIASPQMRAVYQKYKVGLQQIFRYYVSMSHLREQYSSMGYNEFMVFAKDCKILGAFVPEVVLKQLVINAQQLDAEASDAKVQVVRTEQKNEHLSLTFSNFQEIVAALTSYIMCSPYIPFYLRMERFIADILLPRAKRKKQIRGEKAFVGL